MEFSEGRMGMIVEVNDNYRDVVPEKLMAGKGIGTIYGYEHMADIDLIEEHGIFRIEWANGHKSSMHPGNLQPSTKKRLFLKKLGG